MGSGFGIWIGLLTPSRSGVAKNVGGVKVESWLMEDISWLCSARKENKIKYTHWES